MGRRRRGDGHLRLRRRQGDGDALRRSVPPDASSPFLRCLKELGNVQRGSRLHIVQLKKDSCSHGGGRM